MPQKLLRGDKNNQILGGSLHDALAAQARIDARVDGPVDEVFFFVADFGQLVFPLQHIHMAGTTAAYAPAVVLELDTVVERNVQNRFAFGSNVGLGWLAVLKLEGNVDSFHEGIFKRGKNEGTKVRMPAPDSKLFAPLLV